jgi:hypothetical protein
VPRGADRTPHKRVHTGPDLLACAREARDVVGQQDQPFARAEVVGVPARPATQSVHTVHDGAWIRCMGFCRSREAAASPAGGRTNCTVVAIVNGRVRSILRNIPTSLEFSESASTLEDPARASAAARRRKYVSR